MNEALEEKIKSLQIDLGKAVAGGVGSSKQMGTAGQQTAELVAENMKIQQQKEETEKQKLQKMKEEK